MINSDHPYTDLCEYSGRDNAKSPSCVIYYNKEDFSNCMREIRSMNDACESQELHMEYKLPFFFKAGGDAIDESPYFKFEYETKQCKGGGDSGW